LYFRGFGAVVNHHSVAASISDSDSGTSIDDFTVRLLQVAGWSSGYRDGLATRRSWVQFPAVTTNTKTDDRLRACKPPQYFTKPLRPTQLPTLSGTENE